MLLSQSFGLYARRWKQGCCPVTYTHLSIHSNKTQFNRDLAESLCKESNADLLSTLRKRPCFLQYPLLKSQSIRTDASRYSRVFLSVLEHPVAIQSTTTIPEKTKPNKKATFPWGHCVFICWRKEGQVAESSLGGLLPLSWARGRLIKFLLWRWYIQGLRYLEMDSNFSNRFTLLWDISFNEVWPKTTKFKLNTSKRKTGTQELLALVEGLISEDSCCSLQRASWH